MAIHGQMCPTIFRRNLFNHALETYDRVEEQSLWNNSDFKQLDDLKNEHKGTVGEDLAAYLMRVIGSVVNVSEDNNEPYDLIFNTEAVEIKTALLLRNNKGCLYYKVAGIKDPRREPRAANVLFIILVNPDGTILTAVVDVLKAIALGHIVVSEKKSEGHMTLAPYSKQKRSRDKCALYVCSIREGLRRVCLMTGSHKSLEGLENTPSGVFNRKAGKKLIKLVNGFPKFEVDRDNMFSILQGLGGKLTGNVGEEPFRLWLSTVADQSGAPVGNQDGTHGDAWADRFCGYRVWFEVKVSAGNKMVAFYQIYRYAKFDYLIGVHVAYDNIWLYVIPKHIAVDTKINCVSEDTPDKTKFRKIFIRLSQTDNPEHNMFQYRYTLHDGLNKITRILKGNI